MLKTRTAGKATSAAVKSSARGFRPHLGPSRPRITDRVAQTPYAARRQQHFLRSVTTVIALGAFATAIQWSRDLHAEEPPPENEIQFEKQRKKASSKEENRDIISSQHLQVRRSWENPGLYAWGSNTGGVAAPDSSETVVKTPRRIPYFDGVLLRDVKLDRNFGAAIDENGDLIQWGTAFSKDIKTPQKTLRHKNLTSLAASRDRILGLSSDGTVYSVPVSADEQLSGEKVDESTWIPFWTSRPQISYRKLELKDQGWGEKVTSIAGGLEHVLMLTSSGRVFTSAAGSQDFPQKGQLGIPGLTWATRPPGRYDQPHEITTLKGFDVSHIAAGDYHSVVADKQGRVFTFGDNSHGQLGFEYSPDTSFVDTPALLPLQKLYQGTSQVPKVTGLSAGGNNTYFTIDAERVASPSETSSVASPNSLASPASLARLQLGKVTADTWSCGHGIWGQLGNGRFTHIQSTPTKIPSLSGLFEWDEKAHRAIPIRLSRLSVGATHASAVMSNVTEVSAAQKKGASENETNWGADILFFGNNEHYQLGTGKRNNVASPVYIQPLDQVAERKVRGKEEHRFQITPKAKVKVNGRTVELEQRVECGRSVTAVYSGV